MRLHINGQLAIRAFIGMLIASLGGIACASESGSGLSGRVIVGYQGWFGCPGDFEGNASWQHWFIKAVRPQYLTVDLIPSFRGVDQKELCDTGLRRADGKGNIKVFSSQNPIVVNKHFEWMREHGIDGAAAQRFISEVSDPKKKSRGDNVLKNVEAAARSNRRLFYIAYDISGANEKTVVDDIRQDWRHLTNDLRLTDSQAYLRDQGKPVLELWGFGFKDRPGNADDVKKLISDLKSGQDGLMAATVIGGVPAHWRTLSDDSKSDVKWASVYRLFDVLSPWTVGRYRNEDEADNFFRETIRADLDDAHKSGVRYMPVVYPGFSWHNLTAKNNNPSAAQVNQIPRQCGRFFWRQLVNAIDAGVDATYVAMYDEVDEGTAIFPVETRKDLLPAGVNLVYLNEDGCALPDDWYLSIAGKAAMALRRHTALPRDLNSVIRP
ncbi:glycoside hydrolase family 71/99-like protein [Burkholderia sp. Bp9015]|uniref:glycoside hydrolase family 71/99-like protein n=1 Tax=Burkholderia sp. Bp9015 TaxID=2184563 RepID=UPI000F59E631|nr:glycoside hydrolase family 71/99-like protein [Burkholderia sp. Bp9015]